MKLRHDMDGYRYPENGILRFTPESIFILYQRSNKLVVRGSMGSVSTSSSTSQATSIGMASNKSAIVRWREKV